MAMGLPRSSSLQLLALSRLWARLISELNGKLTSMAFHVPTYNMCVMDLSYHRKKGLKYQEGNGVDIGMSPKGILGYNEDHISFNSNSDTNSSIFDADASIASTATLSRSFLGMAINLAIETV
jgi:glyceraldehyde-3-phosphate dehydrogenase/erythrose-4-phosphate dehydrogenase